MPISKRLQDSVMNLQAAYQAALSTNPVKKHLKSQLAKIYFAELKANSFPGYNSLAAAKVAEVNRINEEEKLIGKSAEDYKVRKRAIEAELQTKYDKKLEEIYLEKKDADLAEGKIFLVNDSILNSIMFYAVMGGVSPAEGRKAGHVVKSYDAIAQEFGVDPIDPNALTNKTFKTQIISNFREYFQVDESGAITEKAGHPKFKEEAVEAVDEDLSRFNAQQQEWLLAKCLRSGVKNTNIIKLIDLPNAQLTIALTSLNLTSEEKTDGSMVERKMSDDEALGLINYALTRLDSDNRGASLAVTSNKDALLRKKRELLGGKILDERRKKLGIVEEIRGKVSGINISTLDTEQKAIIESLVKATRDPDAAVSLQKKAQKLDALIGYIPDKEKLADSFSTGASARMSSKKAELNKTLQGQDERIKSLIAMQEIELLFNDLVNPNLNAEQKNQIIALLQLYETGSAGNPFQIVGITYNLPKGLKAIETKYVSSLLPSSTTHTKNPLSHDATSLCDADKKLNERSAKVNQGALSALISLSFFQDRPNFNKQDYSAVGSSTVRETINGIKKSLNLAEDHQAIKSFEEFFTNAEDFSRAAFINQVSLTLFQVLAEKDKKFDTCLAQLKQKPALLKILGIDGVFLEHKLVKETIATALKDDKLDDLQHHYDYVSKTVRDNFINFRNRVDRHELFLETTKDENKDEKADPAINNIEKMDIYTALNDEGKESELKKFFTDLKIANLQPLAEIPIVAFVAREVTPLPVLTPEATPAQRITISDLEAKLKELKTRIDFFALESSKTPCVLEANIALIKAEKEEEFATGRVTLIRQITECMKRVSIQELEKKEAQVDQAPERNTITVLSQLLKEIVENKTGSIAITDVSKHQVTIEGESPLTISEDFTKTLVDLVDKKQKLKESGSAPLVINASDYELSSEVNARSTLNHKDSERDKEMEILKDAIRNLESEKQTQKLEELEVKIKNLELEKQTQNLEIKRLREELLKGESNKTERQLRNAIELTKLYSGGKISLSKETFGERGKSNPVLEARHIKELVNLVEPTRLNGSMYGGLTFDFQGSEPEDVRKFLQSTHRADFRSCTIKNLNLENAFKGFKEEKDNILENFSTARFTNCTFESNNLSSFRFKVENSPEITNGLTPEVDTSSPGTSTKIVEAKRVHNNVSRNRDEIGG